MDQTTLALFIHELRNQCAYTDAGFDVFNQALEKRALTPVFFAAQSVLLTASQISGILWPVRARAKKRGEMVRQILQLPEKHALNDKRLSAIWEHGDEKLEDWISATKGDQVVFDHVGPLSQMAPEAINEAGFYRLYDPEQMIYYYRGNGYKIQAIADAVADVYARVNTVHRQMFPEHHQPTNPQPDVAPGVSNAPDDGETGEVEVAAEEAEEATPKAVTKSKTGAKKKKA